MPLYMYGVMGHIGRKVQAFWVTYDPLPSCP